jgi:hypothetical protein
MGLPFLPKPWGQKKTVDAIVKKGQPGPVKGCVNTTRSNQMVLVFF